MNIKQTFALGVALLLIAGVVILHPPVLYAAQQQDVPATTTTTTGGAPGPLSSASLNWAGYTADTGPYTSVTGSWNVPTVTGGEAGRADATWVGIGGVQSDDLLQAGTEAIIDNSGTVQYQAWYETLPDVSIPVALNVSPGDSMTTTLTEVSANQWHITIRDNTTNQVYTKTLVYDSSLSSAEWVEERVSDVDGSFWPLDNFGSIQFFNASATQNGQQESLSQLNAQPLTMVSGRQILATTSSINAQTGSFTVARSDTATSPQQSFAYASAPTPASVNSAQPQPQVVDISPGAHYIVVTITPDGITVNQDGNQSTQGTNVDPSAYSQMRRHAHRW